MYPSFFQLFFDVPRSLFRLMIPDRCAHCGKIRDFREERFRKRTFGGNPFHAQWCLCEECQDLFFPEPLNICIRCGAFFSGEEGRDYDSRGCRKCWNVPYWFDRVIPFGRYEKDLREAVFLMKKKSGERMTRTAAQMFYESRFFGLRSVRADALIPVPMHWFYRFTRGMNDAQILAQELSFFLNVPVEDKLIKCSRLALAQRAVRMEERPKNVEGIFVPYSSHPDRMRWLGKRAMILDDVMTTGSTVNEAARILKTEFGFADVTVAVIARARGEIHHQASNVFTIETPARRNEALNNPQYKRFRRRKRKFFDAKRAQTFSAGEDQEDEKNSTRPKRVRYRKEKKKNDDF